MSGPVRLRLSDISVGMTLPGGRVVTGLPFRESSAYKVPVQCLACGAHAAVYLSAAHAECRPCSYGTRRAKTLAKAPSIGTTFGSWVVSGPARLGDKDVEIPMRCACGTEKTFTQNKLARLKASRGCRGCYERSKEIGDRVRSHGESGTRLYKIWQGMRSRCSNANNRSWKDYGGRGVRVCAEWDQPHGFPAFRDWALANGYEDHLTIDRIDPAGNYEPTNCRWLTLAENSGLSRRGKGRGRKPRQRKTAAAKADQR